MYDVREYSDFTLLRVAVQFSQHHFLKRLCFLLFCPLCCALGGHSYVGLSLGFLSCSIDPYFCFCASTILSQLL